MVEASRSRTEVIVGFVRQEQPTLRQLLAKLAGARGHFTFEGTPEQAADVAALADGIVVGSRPIQVAEESGAEGLREFIGTLRRAVDSADVATA